MAALHLPLAWVLPLAWQVLGSAARGAPRAVHAARRRARDASGRGPGLPLRGGRRRVRREQGVGGGESEATDEAEAVRREVGALVGAL